MLIGLHWSSRVCHVDEVETNTAEVEETNVVEVSSFVLLNSFFVVRGEFSFCGEILLVVWLSVLV